MAEEAFPAAIRRYGMEASAKGHLLHLTVLAAVAGVVCVKDLVVMRALLEVGTAVAWGRCSSSPMHLGSGDVVVMGFAEAAWKGAGCCVMEAVEERLPVTCQMTRRSHYYAAFVGIVEPVSDGSWSQDLLLAY